MEAIASTSANYDALIDCHTKFYHTDVDNVLDDTNTRFIKYFINFLLVGLCVGLSFCFPLALPAIIAATVGCLSISQLITSNNRSHTVAKGFSLVMGALSGVMIYAVPIFAPAVLGIFAFGSACANVILYGADIPTLFDSVVHYFEDWSQKNAPQKLYSVIKNAVTSLLSVGAAYLMTSGMIAGSIKLIGIMSVSKLAIVGTIATVITAPYIAIPIIAIAFISNVAFAKRGLDRCAKLAKGFYAACMSNKRGALWKYVFDINEDDWKTWGASKKILWGVTKLIGVGAICWFAQSGLVNSLAPKMAALPFLPAFAKASAFLSTITVSAIAARVTLAIPKLNTCVDKACSLVKNICHFPNACRAFWKNLPSWSDLKYSQVVSNNKYKNALKRIEQGIKKEGSSNEDPDENKNQVSKAKNEFRKLVFARAKQTYNKSSYLKKFYYGLCAFKSAVVSCVSPPAILINTIANASFGTDIGGRFANATCSQAFNGNALAQQQAESQKNSVIPNETNKQGSGSGAVGKENGEHAGAKCEEISRTRACSGERKENDLPRASSSPDTFFAKCRTEKTAPTYFKSISCHC